MECLVLGGENGDGAGDFIFLAINSSIATPMPGSLGSVAIVTLADRTKGRQRYMILIRKIFMRITFKIVDIDSL